MKKSLKSLLIVIGLCGSIGKVESMEEISKSKSCYETKSNSTQLKRNKSLPDLSQLELDKRYKGRLDTLTLREYTTKRRIERLKKTIIYQPLQTWISSIEIPEIQNSLVQAAKYEELCPNPDSNPKIKEVLKIDENSNKRFFFNRGELCVFDVESNTMLSLGKFIISIRPKGELPKEEFSLKTTEKVDTNLQQESIRKKSIEEKRIKEKTDQVFYLIIGQKQQEDDLKCLISKLFFLQILIHPEILKVFSTKTREEKFLKDFKDKQASTNVDIVLLFQCQDKTESKVVQNWTVKKNNHKYDTADTDVIENYFKDTFKNGLLLLSDLLESTI